jgi:hypothetical protein
MGSQFLGSLLMKRKNKAKGRRPSLDTQRIAAAKGAAVQLGIANSEVAAFAQKVSAAAAIPIAQQYFPPAVRAGCRQAEAYNLMYYEADTTGLGFLVYNPRDGVTPFGVVVDGQHYRHQHFSLDRYLPNYTMPSGMRYFRDRTLGEAQQLAIKRLASFEGTEYAVLPEDYARVLESVTQEFLRTPMLDRVPVAPKR